MDLETQQQQPVTQQPQEAAAEPQGGEGQQQQPQEAAEPQLFDLPDGTKVTAEELSKQWRDNFMPEFTRRSQENAALKSKLTPQADAAKQPQEAPWAKPDWEPKTYQELAESLLPEAEKRVWERINSELERDERERAEREEFVKREVAELQAIDPEVDVNRVMAHASKYRFPSLVSAHQNLRAIDESVRTAEERILKNLRMRDAAPVGSPSAPSSKSVSFPPDVRTGIEKARYALRNGS